MPENNMPLPPDADQQRKPVDVTGRVEVVPVAPVAVTLRRSQGAASLDQALWVAIRNHTHAIGFGSYEKFIQAVLCAPIGENETEPELVRLRNRRKDLAGRLSYGTDGYQLLKTATEAFLILNCGVLPLDGRFYRATEEEARLGEGGADLMSVEDRLREYLGQNGLPYLARILDGLAQAAPDPVGMAPKSPFCDGTLVRNRPFDPCMLELIWSYWHEEGMLVQALHALSLRFQNKRTVAGDREPLAQLDLHPLRPMSNLLWGYIQDEPFRLTVARRAYEYDHHYGLHLLGKAVPKLRPADSRSKFLEAFHSLLQRVHAFYREDANTTVIADGFPILNGLKEVHMLLAEGAHNQFGDLPWTARVEMLIQQWLLSRREIQDFLRGRPMVPYKEPWMAQADTLRRMMGWGDTPVTHFRDLGVFGEQVLLSVRYGDWVGVNDQEQAKSWARYWRPEIQGYLHAYRAVTGVDLIEAGGDRQTLNLPPAVLLQRRIAQSQGR